MVGLSSPIVLPVGSIYSSSSLWNLDRAEPYTYFFAKLFARSCLSDSIIEICKQLFQYHALCCFNRAFWTYFHSEFSWIDIIAWVASMWACCILERVPRTFWHHLLLPLSLLYYLKHYFAISLIPHFELPHLVLFPRVAFFPQLWMQFRVLYRLWNKQIWFNTLFNVQQYKSNTYLNSIPFFSQ